LQQKKAGWFYRHAEALAGGATYKYNVDEYGNMQKTKVPVSGAHLGMAFAMEALHTIAAGLAGAAEKKFVNIGPDPATLRDQQAKAQATEDYTRRAQVLETNMRMITTARNIGKMDQEQNAAYVAQYKPVLDTIQKRAPGLLEGPYTYADLKAHNVTEKNAIPYMTVPRIDPTTGKQSVDPKTGVPLWDNTYYVVKPGIKLSSLFTPEDLKGFKEQGKTWANNDALVNTPIELSNYLNQKGQLVAWNTAKVAFNNFASTVNDANKTGNTTTPTSGLTMPAIKDPAIASIADQMAAKYQVPAAVVRGVINQESGGNPRAVSPTGAKGVMQLTSGTAQAMGVTDSFDAKQNIEGGVKYLSTLLDPKKNPNLKGDAKLALAAYYSGPGAVNQKGKIVATAMHSAQDTTNYVNSIANATKLGQRASIPTGVTPGGTQTQTQIQAGAVQAGQPLTVDIVEWAKGHPTTASDIDQFVPALSAAGGNYEKALAYLISSGNPEAAGNITAMLGGIDNIHDHDLYNTNQQEQKKIDMQTAAAEEKAQFKQTQDMKASDEMESYVKAPDNYQPDPMIALKTPDQAKATLQAQGVKIPPHFTALYGMAHYHVAPNTFFPKVWAKGSPYEMDSQTAKSYIEQFLNPGYDDTKYPAIQKVRTSYADAGSKPGAAIVGAGTASQHMEVLRQAGEALNNGNIPALNRLVQGVGIETGQSPAMTYDALAGKVNQEVERVAAGGTAPYKEDIERGLKLLSHNASPAQREGVLRAYTNLMYGRLNSLDESYHATTGEHMTNVPKEATQLFQRYGNDVPWAQNNGQGQQQQQRPQAAQYAPVQGAIAHRLPNGTIDKWKYPDGSIHPVAPQGR
jgi:hypothetical protein